MLKKVDVALDILEDKETFLENEKDRIKKSISENNTNMEEIGSSLRLEIENLLDAICNRDELS